MAKRKNAPAIPRIPPPPQREELEFVEEILNILNGATAATKDFTTTAERRDNCAKILHYASCLDTALSKGETYVALNRAILIGMLFEREAEILVHWPHARRGISNLRSTKTATTALHQRAKQRWDEINDYINGRLYKRGNRKQPSLTKIRADAANRFGVDGSLVLRAQKWQRKNSSGKPPVCN
jgi:hypothetical protein